MERDMKTSSKWMQRHFGNPESARATVGVFASVGGTIGFLIAVLAAILSH
jgi:hypothetical protein